MEILNIFLIVLAALGSVLAQSGPSEDYQQAVDATLTTIQISSDLAKEIADQAVVKIEDIVNTLSLAYAEARFSLVHVTNFAAINNLTELGEMMRDDPTTTCANKEILSSMTDVLTSTGGHMVDCYIDSIEEGKEIENEALQLAGEAKDIMPDAKARIEKCSQGRDVACVDAEAQAIMEGISTLEEAVGENVLLAETLISSFHSNLEQCMGRAAVTFVADIGRLGRKMVSCFVKGV